MHENMHLGTLLVLKETAPASQILKKNVEIEEERERERENGGREGGRERGERGLQTHPTPTSSI